ncbi:MULTISPECIES: hypothetical protein [unclassified Saccharibacter]|uniref:hypothetical protein n=1 Tax=unclassified Saccharibacter TaxID=2648722 RepID=UPI00132C2B89|nr:MULTISPECIES: hypothetical protein [unclassified Saccharibacter]MXV36338.1 hypothetical protein [Saccharibacter sp. EH611]MXV57197.1 hypothetical protein [Saccharibacter sp. EH70]MXV66443.1 hypothetical protein [Saccharibacter sp. EH60]
MTEETTTPTAPPITALVEAGENIFSAVTGKKGETQEKIADGAARLLDGVLPTVESKVSFDLASVLAGATGILSGIALVLAGLKKKKTDASGASEEAPVATPAINGMG